MVPFVQRIFKQMKFSISKKATIFIALLGGFMLLLHSGLFSFRTTDKQLRRQLFPHLSVPLSFHDYTQVGHHIHYLQVGEGLQKPVIIFVHGSPGASNAYIDYLADSLLYHQAILVSVDRPGFGFSDFGKTVASVERQAQLLQPLLQKFNEQQVLLVGHSFGGPLIARMAMDFPQLVDGLLMIAPSIDPDLEPADWWRRALNIWGLRHLTPTALRVCNQEIIPLKKDLEAMLPLWPRIGQPVTVIQGAKDRLVPKGNAEFAKRMLRENAQVEIQIVEDGNHFILWTRQSLIKDAILKLLLPFH